MRYTPDNVIVRLCERNDRKPDSYKPKKDDGLCRTDMHCSGLGCESCPFNRKNNPDGSLTMGDLRAEFDKRRALKMAAINVTESHKGGGAGIYITGKPKPSEFFKNPTDYATEVDTAVYHPKHYAVIDDIEAIQIIARSMTVEQFKGYCLGNILKYRMRLGAKDAVEQDLKKAQNYNELFDKYKGLCYDAK